MQKFRGWYLLIARYCVGTWAKGFGGEILTRRDSASEVIDRRILIRVGHLMC